MEKYGKVTVSAITYDGEEPALLCTQTKKQYEEKFGTGANFSVWRLVRIPFSELSQAGYSLPNLPEFDGDWDERRKLHEDKRNRRNYDDDLQ